MSATRSPHLPVTPPPTHQVLPPTRGAWTAGRVGLLVLTVLALIGAAGMFVATGAVRSIDDEHRKDGYLTSDTTRVNADGYAVTVEEIDLDGLPGDWLLGTARLRATSVDPSSSVFVGIAPAGKAADLLRGVQHSTMTEIEDPRTSYDDHAGGAPALPPADSDIWTAQATGPGTQTVQWTPKGGNWTVVIMNSDGTAGIDVEAELGATAPIVTRAANWLLAGGLICATAAGLGVVLLLVGGNRRRARARQ